MSDEEIALHLTLKALDIEAFKFIGTNGENLEKANASNAEQIGNMYKALYDKIKSVRKA